MFYVIHHAIVQCQCTCSLTSKLSHLFKVLVKHVAVLQKIYSNLQLLDLQDGHPPLGWPDTLAYLVLPVLLVVSQYISAQVMQPPEVSYSSYSYNQRIRQMLMLLLTEHMSKKFARMHFSIHINNIGKAYCSCLFIMDNHDFFTYLP